MSTKLKSKTGGYDDWAGNEEGLTNLIAEIDKTMFWAEGHSIPQDWVKQEIPPPKRVPQIAISVVPQGHMGMGVSI